jgi:hypothetical protein
MAHPILVAGAVIAGAAGVGVGAYYVAKRQTTHPASTTSASKAKTPKHAKATTSSHAKTTPPPKSHSTTLPAVDGYTAHRVGSRIVYLPVPPRHWQAAWGPLPDYAHLSAGTCAWHWLASHPPLVLEHGQLVPLAGYVALASYTPRTGTVRQVVLRRGHWPSYGFVADCRNPAAIVPPPVILGR